MRLQNDLPFNFSNIKDPLNLELKLLEKPELVVPFIRYMLGLDTDSEEYRKLKTRWQQGGWMKAGYFHALSDLNDYWDRYKTAIRMFKLSGYDGVSFLLKKLRENRHKLFYQGEKLDMEITREEIESFKKRRSK
ncbi:MAG: hypothetical protein LBG91_04810 [Treponema sp.]|jgi:hypothetical protein|nr:hypothetical protein [Treponema sp.]